mmetsp:Transcript_33378/g.95619  ORF Transcript_33378/g.95619 Transcript_33378/m.95619 type:complete len:203 (-) Transcript_33378:996-1604(-)
MKRVMVTRFETVESKMFASRGMMLNFSFMMKSTGWSSRATSCLERPTDIRMPIIMLRTMFQFSWPKCTARPFFGPRRRCFFRCLDDCVAARLLGARPCELLEAEGTGCTVLALMLGAWTFGLEAMGSMPPSRDCLETSLGVGSPQTARTGAPADGRPPPLPALAAVSPSWGASLCCAHQLIMPSSSSTTSSNSSGGSAVARR